MAAVIRLLLRHSAVYNTCDLCSAEDPELKRKLKLQKEWMA